MDGKNYCDPVATHHDRPQPITGFYFARQAFISTSTPEGRSSFDNASTVLEEEV
jgi:hypothetical protein